MYNNLIVTLPPEKKERTVQKVSDFDLSQFKFDSPCYDFFLIHLEKKTLFQNNLILEHFSLLSKEILLKC